MKPGKPFTIRLGCSDGYKAAPHWHPTNENIAELKGTFAMATGDTFYPTALRDLPTGGYGLMPAHMHHFGLCKGETDLLVYGIGPFQI
ncbi:MAG: cupin domain-containing protein [Candidatus Acidiferrales bacterium]